MAVYRIEQAGSLVTDISVRESDTYSGMVYINIERHIVPENVRGTNEVYMTTVQLEQLGRFLMKQADEIRTAQANQVTA